MNIKESIKKNTAIIILMGLLLTSIGCTNNHNTTSKPKINSSVSQSNAQKDEVTDVKKDGFAELRVKWVESFVGKDNNMNNKNIKRVIGKIDTNAQKSIESMVKYGTILWKNSKTERYKEEPAHIREMYLSLENMAKAYATKESKYYQNEELLNDIKYGLDWLDKNAYFKQEQYGNWWQWEIGIPKAITNICMYIYDKLSKEEINKYTDVVYYYQPNPLYSGASGVSQNPKRESEAANRVDVSLVAVGLGILREDTEQLNLANEAITSLLEYKEPKEDGTLTDGFYGDGSFIQHQHVPYIGTYGNVLLSGCVKIADLLQNSEWKLSEEKIDILSDFAMNSYVPFIYNGRALDMVRGRAISRHNASDKDSGYQILNSLVMTAEVLNKDLSNELKAFVKSCINADTSNDYINSLNNITVINLVEDIMADDSIKVLETTALHKNFPLMDRVIHKTNNYLFGVSMFSNRISNFEYMNGENARAWHTADGMTYLYNNDLNQYTDNYWNTVNPYRLAGTTVSTVKLDKDGLKNNGDNGQKLFTSEDWVGGVTLGNYGANGMALSGDLKKNRTEDYTDAKYDSLRANKSYFMFDDEIVCLGSNINSSEKEEIETIVENRKLKDDSTNIVTVNGEKAVERLNNNEQIKAKWVHLQGNTEKGSDIGYYFPNETLLNINKVQNKNSWGSVNFGAKKMEPVTKTYLEMWISHGVQPKDDKYEYIILPNKSVEEMQSYEKENAIEVLSNTNDLHAVKHNKLNIISFNNWEDKEVTVDGITVNKKVSVMMQEKDDVVELSISDPTMKNKLSIDITVNKPLKKVISADEGIEVIETGNTVKLKVNVNNAQGKTFNIKLKYN